MPFITDASRLPFPKADRVTLHAGAVLSQHLTAAEYNQVCQSIIDVRAWIISGSYYGFLSHSSMPNVQMGTSGTVGAVWISSSLHPYFTTTSSSGLQTRKIVLAPTGTNVWSGWWDQVLVDEQGIVVSGSTVGSGGGGGGSSSTSSLDFLTRDLTASRDMYVSGNASFISLTGSGGGKFLDLEISRNTSLAALTASAGIKTLLDFEATRNLTIGGNASFVSLTGSGGAKFLDVEATRNSILTTVSMVTLTASAGIKSVDVESTRNGIFRNISVGTLTASQGIVSVNVDANGILTAGNVSTLAFVSTVTLTGSRGIKTNLDLESARNLLVGSTTTTAFLTCSNGSRFLGSYDEFNGDLSVNNKGGVNTFSVACTSSFLGPSSFSKNVNLVSITGSGGGQFLDLEVTRNFTLTNVTASSIRSTLDMSVARSFQASSLTSSVTPAGYIFFAGTNGEMQYSNAANGQLSWDNTNKRLGVGIGSALQTLHLGNNAASSNYIRIDASAGTGYFGVDSNGNCVIQAGTANKGVAFYNSAGGSAIINVDSIGNLTGSALVSTGRIVGSKSADVGSASTITIGAGNYAKITSTTTINYITTTAWQAGSQIVLEFAASLTVTHNAGSVPANTAAILLAGAANFSATATDTLTLAYNGTNWIEVCRSVN